MTVSLVAALVAFVVPAEAAPLEISRVPADSKWLLHMDFEAMRGSEVGKRMEAEVEARYGAKVKAIKRMFSVDLLRDLRGITLFGNGRKDEAVVLVDGAMDRAHLEDLVAAADDYRKLEHGRFTVHAWKDGGKSQHAAFFNERLLVFSERESLLRGALDTMSGGASLPADGFFTEGAKPMMVAMARLREIEMDGNEAELLRRANTLKLAMGESDGWMTGRMAAVADDEATGKRLRRVLDGMLAFAELDENLAGKFELKTEVKPLAGGAQGAAVEVSMPVAELLGMMKRAGILAGN